MKSRVSRVISGAIAVAVIGVVSVGLAACSGSGSSASGSASTHQGGGAIAMSSDGFVLGTQMWVAQEKGYFKQQGVTVQPQIFQSGADGVRALAGGQVDLAIALDFASITSLSDGLRLLGTVASPKPGFYSLVVRQGIAKPADLTGKKIGFQPGAQAEYVNRKFLEQAGVGAANVQLVSLPGESEIVASLKTGQIDAAWLTRAAVAQVKTDKQLSVLNDDSSVASTQGIYLIGRTDWIKQNEASVEKVLKAFAQASDFIVSDPQGSASIVAAKVHGDLGPITASLPSQGYQVRFTKGNLQRLEELKAFLVNSGKITATKPIKDYLDLTAMRAVFPEKVESP